MPITLRLQAFSLVGFLNLGCQTHPTIPVDLAPDGETAILRRFEEQVTNLNRAFDDLSEVTEPRTESRARAEEVEWINLPPSRLAHRADVQARLASRQEPDPVPEPPPIGEVPGGAVDSHVLTDSKTANISHNHAKLSAPLTTEEQDTTDLARALSAALLSAGGESDMDDEVLGQLEEVNRHQVKHYHDFVTNLRRILATGASPLDGQQLRDTLRELMGKTPLHIRTVQLCRRVSGFGVYEALPRRSFLVGRQHWMIVYVELDHFQAIEKDRDLYQVKLAQEIVLYTDDDHGLAVWHEPRHEFLDESRNRRRDFFVIQKVRLPPRLSVGKYRLKVRVTDLHGQTRSEMTIPIEIVADERVIEGRDDE